MKPGIKNHKLALAAKLKRRSGRSSPNCDVPESNDLTECMQITPQTTDESKLPQSKLAKQ